MTIEVNYNLAAYDKIEATLPEYPVLQSPLLTQISSRWGNLVTQVENGLPFTFQTKIEFFDSLADWLLTDNPVVLTREDWNKHNFDLLIRFENLGIHYYEELDKARKATVGYIMKLDVPIDARLKLAKNITGIPVHVDGVKNIWRTDQGQSSVTVSPSRDIVDINSTEQAFWQRSNVQLIRAIIQRNFAHELGHEVNNLVASITNRSISNDYGAPHMDDFPVTYSSKGDERTIDALHNLIMDERFAQHFGYAVPIEAGLPQTAIIDAIRKDLVSMYGLKINPDTLINIFEGILDALHQKGNATPQQPARRIRDYYYEILLPNKPLALALPFSREAIESMITQAWQDTTIKNMTNS